MYKNTNIITAKELRDNLGEITKRVMNGEQIQVSYRGKPALSIEPIPKKEPVREPLSGLHSLLKHLEKIDIPSEYQRGDIKQIYRDQLDKKYGIKK